MGPMRVGGIALALSITAFFNFIALFYLLEKKIGKVEKKKVTISAFKCVSAGIVMGFSVWAFFHSFSFYDMNFLNKVLFLAGTIFLGAAVYLVLSFVFNNEEMKAFRLILSRKKIKKIEGS